jgi:anaerobic dimethyl sulfoxide reductase subunit C
MEVPYPLLVFTLLTGLSVGAACIAAVAEFCGERYARISRSGAYLAVPAVAIGMIASAFHLAKPMSFLLGLSRPGSSWISREGWVGIVYLICTFLFALSWYMSDRNQASWKPLRTLFAVLSGVSALVMLYVQAMAYATVRAIPAWNSPLTVVLFAASAFALGTLALGAVLGMGASRIRDTQVRQDAIAAVKPFATMGVIALVLLIVVAVLWWVQLSTGLVTPASEASLRLIGGAGIGLTLLRVIVGLAIPLLLMIYVVAKQGKQPTLATTWVVVSFILVVVGEVVARQLFFLAAIHI